MTVQEFDAYIRGFLAIDEFTRLDHSRNGLQVDRQNQEIHRVACAVDAAQQVFEEAAQWKADLLFVHHGLFWGREEVLVGTHYGRVRTLLDNDLALYAVHLPLDSHLSVGNNAVMAEVLGLADVEPFGLVRNVPIGVAGSFSSSRSLQWVVDTLFGDRFSPLAVLPFGPPEIRTVGIISGGAPLEVDQAIEQGIDLYITGDANHITYHRCRDAGINAVFAGHYATEIWGVQRMAERIAADTPLVTTFLDIPTGM
jgi:dinuclear metal center YbgI/SA1388 family protein